MNTITGDHEKGRSKSGNLKLWPMDLTWVLIRNAESQAPKRMSSAQDLHLNEMPGDLCGQ